MSKIYLLDTSTIVYDPLCFKSFKDNTVIICLPVLEELDKLKKQYDEAGKNARVFIRLLDKILNEKKDGLERGIKLDNNITLKLETKVNADNKFGSSLYGDNLILSVAANLVKENKANKVIIISKDIALRIRAKAFGISAEDYLKDNTEVKSSSITKTLEISDKEVNELYKLSKLELSDDIINKNDFQANEFITITDSSGEEVANCRFLPKLNSLKLIPQHKNVFGIGPKNLEQQFALDLLLDNDVKLVMLSGPSGTGKTLMTLAAGLYNIMERPDKKYEKLIIIKPIISVGKDLGTLPGSKLEKLEPFISNFKDQLNFLMKNSKQKGNKINIDPYLSLMIENGTIELEAISYLRGRSLPGSFIIIDEIQNCSIHELKTILTRIGEGSKIVLLGDHHQIDNLSLTSDNNALIHALGKFRNYPIAGSVYLKKGERSELATLAAEIL